MKSLFKEMLLLDHKIDPNYNGWLSIGTKEAHSSYKVIMIDLINIKFQYMLVMLYILVILCV